MVKQRLAFELILAMLLVATPALAGGAALLGIHGYAQSTNESGYMNLGGIATSEFVSGVDPLTWGHTVCQSYIDNSTTRLESIWEARDVYFSAVNSQVKYESKKDQYDYNRLMNVTSYVLLPNKFDSVHSEIMNVSLDGSHAKVYTNFTYNGKPYSFTKDWNLSENTNINMFLQPFCPEFEGLGIESSHTFEHSESTDGLNYQGSLTLGAVKN